MGLPGFETLLGSTNEILVSSKHATIYPTINIIAKKSVPYTVSAVPFNYVIGDYRIDNHVCGMDYDTYYHMNANRDT